MWQVLLAAAVAGSGILAKKLIIDPNASEPISSSKQDDQQCDALKDPENFNEFSLPKDSIFTCNGCFPEDHNEAKREMPGDGSIFKFSSTSSSEMGPKSWRKKMAGEMKGNVEGLKRNSKGKGKKKCGVLGCEKQGWVVDQRRSSKRLSFGLKKRRTSKNVTGKCQSCASKGNSFFTWGISVGMMYMMSAGKAEISRLNHSVDETAKIVQELKAELSRRKTLQNKLGSMDVHTKITKSSSQKTDALKIFKAEEGECASSVLTEEQQIEALEMDQLEAELKSELQKLPWSSKEDFGFEGREDIYETDNLARGFQAADDQDMISHQFNGIQPSDLDQKLSHLLIEQQERHIAELEVKLEGTHSKLYDKEAELQALKDCVRRLTEVSLDDEDTEFQMEDEKTGLEDRKLNKDPQSTKSMVGMKRVMDFESYD